MNNTPTRSVPVRFAVDALALAVLSLALLFGGTQSGIVTPTVTWITGALVSIGLCSGVAVWRYSAGTERDVLRPRLSGYPLALAIIAVLVGGLLWVAFVPPVYGADLVYGVLTMAWTAVALSYGGRLQR